MTNLAERLNAVLTDPGALIVQLNGTSPEITTESPSGPVLIDAAALMAKKFPDPRWAVPGIFPEGLTLLVGAPKLGKSWLGLNVGVAVAHGGRALGKIAVDDGDVLYLALEDTQRRLQERLAMTLRGDDAPERLDFATGWPGLAEGATHHLSAWLAAHPAARLVIVDTFQKLRGPIAGGQNLYAADYEAAGELKRVADRFGVAIVCIHHTRKLGADDPLDTVSGTSGLAGAADTILVLRREIGRHDATIYVRGRDVPEADHALGFDAETCSWSLMGDAATFRMSEERRAIMEVIAASSEPMSPKHISEALGKKDGAVRKLLHSMSRSGEVVGIGGVYHLPLIPGNTGNTGNVRGGDGDFQRYHVTGVTEGREGDEARRPPGGIWCCVSCSLPRSTGPGSCPSCGATGGGWRTSGVA